MILILFRIQILKISVFYIEREINKEWNHKNVNIKQNKIINWGITLEKTKKQVCVIFISE